MFHVTDSRQKCNKIQIYEIIYTEEYVEMTDGNEIQNMTKANMGVLNDSPQHHHSQLKKPAKIFPKQCCKIHLTDT